MSTKDSLIFEDNMSSSSSDFPDKPFLKKELVYIIDNNGGTDYGRNEVTFETVSISNNGRWSSYKDAFISIPLVIVATRNLAPLSAADALNTIHLKCGNTIMIDSCSIDYGNDNVQQQSRNIHAHCVFIQHTQKSVNDVLINGPTDGYQKPSNKWIYANSQGLIANTENLVSPFDNATLNNKDLVLSHDNLSKSGQNLHSRHEIIGAGGLVVSVDQVFYYDCIIKLKDLSSFFENMPLIRGGNVKITLTLNQCDSSFTYAHGTGTITAASNTLKGSLNPILRKIPTAGFGGTSFIENISCRVVKNSTYSHTKQQCRLYVPVYTISPSFESQYLSLSQKKIVYEDVFVKKFTDLGGNFQLLVTNSMNRMKRLVIMPMLHKTANGTLLVEPSESLFSNEPSNCSPHYIRDFNVQLSGSNLYSQNVQYKYQSFMNEMNGNYGVNANLQTITSGQINQNDYNSTFGYIVVDLSRRYSLDEMTPLSVQISGFIESAKKLDFLCFISYTKEITVDLATGQKLS